MGEVKRSVFILKKGYQSQKITIIENLYRLMKEPGANEELLPIILNSMEIWDEKMQQECATNFEKGDVIKLMTNPNQTKLMDECLGFILNADITHEELITEWLKVFKKLVMSLSMDYIKNNVIKKIVDLPSAKNQYPKRKIGFEMFCSIINAKGEEGLKSDPNLIKILMGMCMDRNWKFRKQGAQFLYNYMQQLHHLQKKAKKPEEEQKSSNKSPSKIHTNSFAQSQQVQDVVKITKQRYKSHFYDVMVELAGDEDAQVQIEGIEIMTEYLLVVKKRLIESDYIPHLEKMMKLAQDPVTADEVRIRMTKISGKVLDKLAQCMLATKFEPMFMEFFKITIKDKNIDVRIQAAYNLPCFYFTFRTSSEDNQEYFDQIYRELIVETQNQNVDILKTLSASIHEPLSLISYDQGSLGSLNECVRVLMNSPHRAVRDALATNIDQIIENYMKENDLKEIIETIVMNQNQGINGNNLMLPATKDFGQKTTKNFQINQIEETSGRGGTGSRQNRVKALLRPDDESNGGSDNKNSIVRLQDYVEIDLVPEDNHKEFLYSRLLDDILTLNKNIMADKGNWRTHEIFIQNLAQQLHNFNAVEILDTLGSQMFELLRSNCDQVKSSAAFFICNLINIQYKQQRRQELIDLVITEYAKSNSFSLRKAYIAVCISAVKVFSFKTFKTYFLDDYMTMVNDPVAEVRVKWLQSAPTIRPYLEQDIDLMLKFNNSLNHLQTQDHSKNITELAQKINSQLIKNKGQPSQNGYNDGQEKIKQAFEKKLAERELFEDEQRKKKSEEEEDSKFDYLTLLVNTTKKYGNMRRAGGGAITFKQLLNKKSTPISGMKQFSSPPVLGKPGGIGVSQPPQFPNGSANSTATSNGTVSNLLLGPNQQTQAMTPNTLTQTTHFKKRGSQMISSTSKNTNQKTQPGLFPPIGSVIKDQNTAKDAIRTVRKSELILQSQIIQNPISEVGVNSATNSNYQPNSFSSVTGKRTIAQKMITDGISSQSSQNGNSGPMPNEVHSILKKNQINVSQGSSLNGFSHSNSLGGPYSNNYLSTGQSGSYSNGISATLLNGGQISSLNKKRLSSEDLDRPIQSGSNSNTVSRTNLNSQNQKH